jgi:putative PIN family toxin of toxin-antitoxin system
MRVERVVIDTNVLISAVLSPLGKPFACLHWVLDNATLIVSRELLEEVETRLARPNSTSTSMIGDAGRS